MSCASAANASAARRFASNVSNRSTASFWATSIRSRPAWVSTSLVEGQEGIELVRPFDHSDRPAALRLIFGVVEIHRDDAVEFLDLLGLEVVLGAADIALAYDRAFPTGQAHLGRLGSMRLSISSAAVLPVIAQSILF